MKFVCRLKHKGIRAKLLFAFIPFLMLIIGVTIFTSSRVAVLNLREAFANNLKYVVDEYCYIVEAFPDLDQDKLATILNEKMNIGKTGFACVLDMNGTMLIHRKIQGENWAEKPFIAHVLKEKNGIHRYISPKTNTWKLAAFKHLESKKLYRDGHSLRG